MRVSRKHWIILDNIPLYLGQFLFNLSSHEIFPSYILSTFLYESHFWTKSFDYWYRRCALGCSRTSWNTSAQRFQNQWIVQSRLLEWWYHHKRPWMVSDFVWCMVRQTPGNRQQKSHHSLSCLRYEHAVNPQPAPWWCHQVILRAAGLLQVYQINDEVFFQTRPNFMTIRQCHPRSFWAYL